MDSNRTTLLAIVALAGLAIYWRTHPREHWRIEGGYLLDSASGECWRLDGATLRLVTAWKEEPPQEPEPVPDMAEQAERARRSIEDEINQNRASRGLPPFYPTKQ